MIINKKLGEGSFSKVYECIRDGKTLAVKMESKSQKNSLLDYEYKIHSFLYKKNKIFILPVYDYFEDNDYRYILMEKMWMSFGQILKKIEMGFDDLSLKNTAKNLIYSLEVIHENGICHGDIKPENLLISLNYDKVYLIDFGLSRYFQKNGNHINYKTNVNPSGTMRYMSFHTNNYEQMSRRDDLISLGYVLVYLQRRFLPWQIISDSKYKKVGEMKKNICIEELCKDCVPCLKEYLKYCYNLEFDEKPNYDYLWNLFDT